MNIYQILGLEDLLQPPVWQALNDEITEETRYIIPGYQYNYRLCTFPEYIEFQRCELPDGTPVDTIMHFSANNHWELEAQSILKENITAPIYAMKNKNGHSVPVRVICPDVLPSIERGDCITGQVVAFADSVTKLPDEATTDGEVVAAREDYAIINGFVQDVILRRFEFEGIDCWFWEMDVDTENGPITVLFSEDAVVDTPETGDIVSAHALISMDVAINHPVDEDAAFYVDPYEDVFPDSDGERYKNGFLPNFQRNQKALIQSIATGNLSRFTRCCAESILVFDKEDTLALDKDGLVEALKEALPERVVAVEVRHILQCEEAFCLGHDGIVVSSERGVERIVWLDINRKGLIDRIAFLSPTACSLGIDWEFHLHAIYAHATCDCKPYLLREYLADGCMYRSEYADVCLIGAGYIINRFEEIDKNLDETNAYTFEHALVRDELNSLEDLPIIYQGIHCTVAYQADELAYVVLLMLDDEHRICNILMSRNANYLKRFERGKVLQEENHPEIKNVKEILVAAYGTENTVDEMREGEIPDSDPDGVYVWKKADEFAVSWLRDNEYQPSEVVLTDDCIGYACERRGVQYAVFFYAYGEKKTTLLDGDYCSKLRNEAIAQGREIIIIYLHVTKTVSNDGTTEYTVGSYGEGNHQIEPWLLTTVMGKNILRFYPKKEMMDLIPRLMAAYNSKHLDALRVLFTDEITLETYEHGGYSMNDGVYSHLAHIREEHGKMKMAYIRFSDVVFCAVPYIENYAYVTFTAAEKIDSITINPLNDTYCELLILEEDVDHCDANTVPAIMAVDFLPPSDVARFSVRVTFANGEVKRYDLSCTEEGEVVSYERHILTDKIFANGRVVDHLPLPKWMGYQNYNKRGQGIEFASGVTLSAEELYHNGYPVGKFSYAGMAGVRILQFDYDEDGFGVGCISGMDPTNPSYLLDRNTMTATVLPSEYQDTPLGIYPFYGGYSEGLVMVSKMGRLDLQYHHNRGPCAGLWGWLDRDLNVVIEPKYIYAMNFVNGRAIVCKGDWEIKTTEDGKEKYWCENERWGVIDQSEKEIVPCRFDELYEIGDTDRLYFVHEGGWEKGTYAIFDIDTQQIILTLDFDFDMGYMFNDCFVADGDILVFDDHLAGEGKDLIYAYDLVNKEYIVHGEPWEERTYNGERKVIVQKDGEDIIVF